MKANDLINFDNFLAVFEGYERMPKDKRHMMEKLYEFYNYGVKNERERIKDKIEQFILPSNN